MAFAVLLAGCKSSVPGDPNGPAPPALASSACQFSRPAKSVCNSPTGCAATIDAITDCGWIDGVAAAADGTDYLTTEPSQGSAGQTAFLTIAPTRATATLEPIRNPSTPALDSTGTPYLLPVLQLSPDFINTSAVNPYTNPANPLAILKQDGAAWSSISLSPGGLGPALLTIDPSGSPYALTLGAGVSETVPAPAALVFETDGGWVTANLDAGLTIWSGGRTSATIVFDDSDHSYTLFPTGGVLGEPATTAPTSLVEAVDGVGETALGLTGVGQVYGISPAGDAGAPVVLELVGWAGGTNRFALARPNQSVLTIPYRTLVPSSDCSLSPPCSGTCTQRYPEDGGEALVRTADGTVWLVDAWTQFDLDEAISAPAPGESYCSTAVMADHSSAVLEVLRVPLDGSMRTMAWQGSLPAFPPHSGPGSPGWGLWASASGQRILIGVDERIVELDTSRF